MYTLLFYMTTGILNAQHFRNFHFGMFAFNILPHLGSPKSPRARAILIARNLQHCTAMRWVYLDENPYCNCLLINPMAPFNHIGPKEMNHNKQRMPYENMGLPLSDVQRLQAITVLGGGPGASPQ